MFSKHGQSLKVLMMPIVSMTVSHLCQNLEIDVVSLFTKTPIQQTLTIIREGLEKDQDLKKRINLEVDDIMDFTEFVATTTYFSFRGQLFNQKFGTAMGSPVSPILANFFMEWLEQQAIATAPIDCKPKLWKIYVDDVLEIIKRGKVEALTGHLNGTDETNKHQIHARIREKWPDAVSGHPYHQEGGRIHQTTGLQESHTHRPVRVVSIASSTSAQTCCHTDVIGKE